MLKSLYIDNYALIENLKIEFHKGLSIITGETGAGKSILLGALSLLTGKRADTSVLFDKEKKCVVEAIFDIKSYNLKDLFEKNDLEYDDNLIIRREIQSSGKSRAFINDTPVNLDVLQEISSKIIDIHSQHENLILNDPDFQLKVVDIYGDLNKELEVYKSIYKNYNEILREFNLTEENYIKLKKEVDYYNFLYKELEEANLKENELSELEIELEQLTHAEEIKSYLQNILKYYISDELNLIASVKDVLYNTERLRKYIPEADNLSTRLNSIIVELKDLFSEYEKLDGKIFLDPERLDYVNQRLNKIYNLLKKHNVKSEIELLEIKTDLKNKLDIIENSDERLKELENALKEKEKELMEKANYISEKRKKIIPELENKITSMLSEVGMPQGRVKIELSLLSNFTERGIDAVSFKFSANKNVPLQDISKVASGGEISRLMLCIKSLLSEKLNLPTIIFDEIDTGISGEIANRVGEIIKNISKNRQVINITHLPQIASKGNYHYLVYKDDNSNRTKTYIRVLSDEEREIEIARMLSGEQITEAAIINARELLKK